MQVTAGKWKLDVEELRGRHIVQGRYVVRLQNGYALSLGANRAGYEELIRKVAAGEMDEWIDKHCNGGRPQCTT
jgi:hypothetical protein